MIQPNTFAEACYAHNTLEELRAALSNGPDRHDMMEWNLSEQEWREQIEIAVKEMELDQIENPLIINKNSQYIRQCRRCKKYLSILCFYKSTKSYCKECNAEKRAEWIKNNPERHKELSRRATRKWIEKNKEQHRKKAREIMAQKRQHEEFRKNQRQYMRKRRADPNFRKKEKEYYRTITRHKRRIKRILEYLDTITE